MGSVADILSDFALDASQHPNAMDIMRLSLLDWAAVGLAGAQEPVARILRDQALEERGVAEATLIGATQRVPCRMAALVNGTTTHALDYDDTHFGHIGHPSTAVIPAALAVAERTGASVNDFQQACLIGVEASIRVGLWLGRDHYQTGFHQTATAGAFGATLAASKLLRLDHRQMRMALGIASTRASGLKSQFGTMAKPLNAGIAAQNGVEAALLAAKGFVAAPDGVDGPQGFGPTHHGAADDDAWQGLGETWLFTDVQHKFHACCHGLHAALEALSKLQAPPSEVTGVTVYTHPRWMSVCNLPEPQTGLEAKFSYGMVVAMALCGQDTARLDVFSEAACTDEKLGARRSRVTVVADDALGEMQARLVVECGAQEEVLFHDLNTPLDINEKTSKLQSKAASLIGKALSERVWHALTGPTDLKTFTECLASPQG